MKIRATLTKRTEIRAIASDWTEMQSSRACTIGQFAKSSRRVQMLMKSLHLNEVDLNADEVATYWQKYASPYNAKVQERCPYLRFMFNDMPAVTRSIAICDCGTNSFKVWICYTSLIL